MDRITRLRISNMRAITDLDLELSPFTVLIGENGSGKSTILEALELLRKAADPSFLQQLYTIHRGLPALLRKGASSLRLGVVIEDPTGVLPRLEYAFVLRPGQLVGAHVTDEHLLVGPLGNQEPFIRRDVNRAEVFLEEKKRFAEATYNHIDQLVIHGFGASPPTSPFARLLAVLRSAEVHLGMDTLAAWAAQSTQRLNPLRSSMTLFPVERLALLGHNLANAWFALKNQSEVRWQETLALARLGLGDVVDSINTIPEPGGGAVALVLKRVDLDEPLPAMNLSDGQLAWLAFVAMTRLNPNRSLLAIDEPELHLHPSLLGRVIELLTALEDTTVLLSTHSDRILELLADPVSALRVCGLQRDGAVSVSRLDAAALPQWQEKYGDLGQLRSSGYLHRALRAEPGQ